MVLIAGVHHPDEAHFPDQFSIVYSTVETDTEQVLNGAVRVELFNNSHELPPIHSWNRGADGLVEEINVMKCNSKEKNMLIK